ncbi:MAG: 5'-methylthioadenosine/adenosylhomocysteine nucleosidase [Treponema sp.]|jgi:adenosylhomocysteine nucleosidase|nr:5'-methylthioadenosine/adenosylhomocysteine nucleosidase [Treponema sp.]
MNKIGIIGAMDVEINIFCEEMEKNGSLKKTECGNLVFNEGNLCGKNVVVVKSGIGKVNAALCAQRLILQFGVEKIINTGIAGAIQENLHIHDMVVSTDAVYHDMDATAFGYEPTEIPQMHTSAFDADEKMIAAAEKAFAQSESAKKYKLIRGRIASGDQFISYAEQKEHIEEICSPACVEMEGAAIAHACFLNQVPFVILRCISDNADDSYEVTYSFNERIASEECASVVLKMLEFLD